MKIEYNGRMYLVSRVDVNHWSFTAHGETFMYRADMDLQHEFGENAAAWCQFIDDVMIDLHLIYYDDELEKYVNSKDGPKIQVVGPNHPDYLVQH